MSGNFHGDHFYSCSLIVAMLLFKVGPFAILAKDFYVLTGKLLYLPVNADLHIPENLIHFFGTTFILSTVSSLLLAASYPSLYGGPSSALLSVFFSL
jgi:hypothetical protein